ncbi:UNVERIFIED_CONTAM: hypothetical protein PYX00_011740 [Menopon gallinae]|uniref:GOLD domain-containing protein n=1 Tax=Menopon gallinae TaxID=328185 RepID=A0AAW2H8J5_9NEOP
MIVLGPSQKFSFEEEFEADNFVKFEFSEESGLSPRVSVADNNNAIVAVYNKQSGATLHTKAAEKALFTFTFENPTGETMNIWFMLADMTKEPQGLLGPISESSVVAELKDILENIIISQRKHLERQKSHEETLRSSKRLMTFLLIFEAFFCAAVVYYLHLVSWNASRSPRATQPMRRFCTAPATTAEHRMTGNASYHVLGMRNTSPPL